ncbi:hypothetical protein [Massilia sp. BKSP1R2A-1]|uniref:hypothetical protein n=1 Tax=Massilia sp. BKSP1R2A-1 TaxID=3422595 RepID=UPI003D334C6B
MAVAAISVSATLLIGIALVKDIIVPAYTEQLKNQLAEYPQVKEKNEKLQAEIEELQGRLATAKSETALALTANAFVRGDPYPVGLNLIRIGDPATKIEATFKAEQIQKQKHGLFWSVKTNHPIFTQVAYYFDLSSGKPTVRALLLFVDHEKYKAPYLKNKLLSVLGEPKGRNDEEKLFWITNDALVTVDDQNYSIDPASRYRPSKVIKK